MSLDSPLPSFVREAFDADSEIELSLIQTLDTLPALLGPSTLRPDSASRLLARVSPLPLRYAPFFDRLGVLWDLPEASVLEILARAADPAAWRKPALPGLSLIDVTGGPRLEGASVHLVKFAPGMRYPKHRHRGPETLLVLEGSYRDQSGRVVGPGDLHEMPADSEHRFRVNSNEPCVAASIQFGYEFTGAVMRILVRLFG